MIHVQFDKKQVLEAVVEWHEKHNGIRLTGTKTMDVYNEGSTPQVTIHSEGSERVIQDPFDVGHTIEKSGLTFVPSKGEL